MTKTQRKHNGINSQTTSSVSLCQNKHHTVRKIGDLKLSRDSMFAISLEISQGLNVRKCVVEAEAGLGWSKFSPNLFVKYHFSVRIFRGY